MLPKTVLPLEYFLSSFATRHRTWKIVSTKGGRRQRPLIVPRMESKASRMVGRDNDAWCMEEEGRDGVRSACTRALMAPGTRLEDDIKQQVQRSVHCRSRWMSSCGLVNRPPTPSSSSTPYSFPPRRHVSLQKRPTRFVLRTASCTKASASFPRTVIISIDLEIG